MITLYDNDDTLKALVSAVLMLPAASRISSVPREGESKSDGRNRYRHEAAQAAWEAVTAAEHVLEELAKRKSREEK